MTSIRIDEFKWDSLLISEKPTIEDQEKQQILVSEYVARQPIDSSVDPSSYHRVAEIMVDNSFLERQEIALEKITNDQLFEYLKSENVRVEIDYLFPKTDNIDRVFWFLHHLSKEDISEAKIRIENLEDLSIEFYHIVENAMFLGFLKRIKENDEVFLIATPQFEEFLAQDLEKQYHLFLASLGRNETISEALRIQLNDSIFDNISRQMLHNILVNDPNIQNESLTKTDIDKIVNNLRYWYLSIRQAILLN